MNASVITDLRKEIDVADDQIVQALKRRFELTDRMREVKSLLGLPGKDESRERDIMAKVLEKTPLAHRDVVASIYERLFGGSRGVIETIVRGVAIQDGKVLLCRAKGGKTTYLPGGHIEFGEKAAEALVREIKEELGAESKCGEFLGMLENAFLQHGKRHCEINLIYRLELPPGTPAAAKEDWIEFEWRDLTSLDEANLLPENIKAYVKCS